MQLQLFTYYLFTAPLYYYHYAVFNAPCVGRLGDEIDTFKLISHPLFAMRYLITC